MRITQILIITIILTAASCTTKKEIVTEKEVEITTPFDRLQKMMQGSYDSSEQAAADETYYDITLHIYPIWEDRIDGKYLYVEQSVTSNEAEPYRQRVYKLEDRKNGTIASYVYTIKDDSLYIGKWKDPSFFDDKGLEIIEIREGCEVILAPQGERFFIGKTGAKSCKSTLRGASYATSIVVVEEGSISSWDQGFDDKGEQVWGAVKGPYMFKHKKQ